MILACLGRQMPEDWPDRAANQAKEKTDLEEARKTDPSLPDP